MQPLPCSLGDVVRTLSLRGPLSRIELRAALGGAPALAELLDSDAGPIVPLADGRLAWLPALLQGRVFTHRLTATEAAHDLIEVGVDLAALAMLTELDTYRQLCDGTPVAEIYVFDHPELLDERAVPVDGIDTEYLLVLPVGRFAALGAGPGDLIALRVERTGFALDTLAEPAAGEQGAELAAVLTEHGQPELLDAVVWTACAYDDDAFRTPTAPLGELLAMHGLIHRGDWLAADGFDFTAGPGHPTGLQDTLARLSTAVPV